MQRCVQRRCILEHGLRLGSTAELLDLLGRKGKGGFLSGDATSNAQERLPQYVNRPQSVEGPEGLWQDVRVDHVDPFVLDVPQLQGWPQLRKDHPKVGIVVPELAVATWLAGLLHSGREPLLRGRHVAPLKEALVQLRHDAHAVNVPARELLLN